MDSHGDVNTGGQQPATGPVQAQLRYFLPSGPPLTPRRWQRKWKVGIRLGSILVAVLFVAAATVAVVVGTVSTSHFTASGVVNVDCTTRAKPFTADIAEGAPVRIVDAKSGEDYGSARLSEFIALKSGICLLGFTIDNVPVADLYTVQIGTSFRALASESSLRGGALLS